MNNYRFLMWPGYLIAASLIFIPLLDTVLPILPPRIGDVSWRFGAAGLFSRAAMTPLLGLFIALLLATYFKHRRVVRVLAGICGVMAVLIVVVVVLFGLDALEMRRQVRPDAQRSFDTATALALVKYAWTSMVLVIVTLVGWKASRASPADRARAEVMPLITGDPALVQSKQV